MINARPLTTPTVHLNGTSADTLLEQLRQVSDALSEARAALSEATPNGRDYYPQGADAVYKARREHDRRCEMIGQIMAEIGEMYEAIEEQASARAKRVAP